MELTDWIQALVVALLFIVPVAYIVIRIKRAKPKPSPEAMDAQKLIDAFKADNIVRVTFVRNKLNVLVQDHRRVNHDALKAQGAIGINIVGDTIKLYFDGDNEAIYEQVKALLGDAS